MSSRRSTDPIVLLKKKIDKAKHDKKKLLSQWNYNISQMRKDYHLYRNSKNPTYKKVIQQT